MSVATMAPAAFVVAVMAPAPGLFVSALVPLPLGAFYLGESYIGGGSPVQTRPGTMGAAPCGVATMEGAA